MKKVKHNLTGRILLPELGVKGVLTVSILLLSAIYLTECTEDPDKEPNLNTLETIDSEITPTTAILRGEILSLGNLKIIEYGIEYSKSMIFSPSYTKGFTTPPLTGVYQVEITGLDPNTLYYYKAYVLINTARVYSENVCQFTTKQ